MCDTVTEESSGNLKESDHCGLRCRQKFAEEWNWGQTLMGADIDFEQAVTGGGGTAGAECGVCVTLGTVVRQWTGTWDLREEVGRKIGKR